MTPPSFASSNPNKKCHSAWCGDGPSKWLQVQFDKVKGVSRLRTKGSKLGHAVTSFYLAYSVDGVGWTNYTYGGVRQVGTN